MFPDNRSGTLITGFLLFVHIRAYSLDPKHEGGGGFFYSKGTWGCAARKGMLFRTSSLAKGVLLAILVELSLGKGMLFGNFGQRNVKIR